MLVIPLYEYEGRAREITCLLAQGLIKRYFGQVKNALLA